MSTPIAITGPGAAPSPVTTPAAPAAIPADATARPAALVPNPSMRLDVALQLVVIEFRDDAGKVTSSIPTEAQLSAYRRTMFAPSGSRDGSGGSGVAELPGAGTDPPQGDADARGMPAKPGSQAIPGDGF